MNDKTPQQVTVTNIKIPFFSLMFFLVELIVAAIPALIIASIVLTVIGMVIMGVFGGLAQVPPVK